MSDALIGLSLLYGMGIIIMMAAYGDWYFHAATRKDKKQAAWSLMISPLWPFIFIVGVTRIVTEVIKTALSKEDETV